VLRADQDAHEVAAGRAGNIDGAGVRISVPGKSRSAHRSPIDKVSGGFETVLVPGRGGKGDVEVGAGNSGRDDMEFNAAANAVSADIVQRASVAIIAGGTVRPVWVRTDPGPGVASAGRVTLIARGACDRVAAATNSRDTNIARGAGIAIVT
jgi:hypothetical protein